MLKRPTRLLLEQLGLGGEELFVEELLEIIRRGNRAYSSFLDFLKANHGKGVELSASIDKAISRNQGRFLETAIRFLTDGPCRDDLLRRISRDFLCEKAFSYYSSGNYEKAAELSYWLLLQGTKADQTYINAVLKLLETGRWMSDTAYLGRLLKARKDNVETFILRARYYHATNNFDDFILNALMAFSKAPEEAKGLLGERLVALILDGNIKGIEREIDETVLEAFKTHGINAAKRAIQNQFDMVSAVLSELTKHSDAIHEWNEWALSDFEAASSLIPSKILDEAEKGHRKSVALTRYLQTFEEPEFDKADTYPMWLEVVSFCIEPGDVKMAMVLDKSIPPVLCDERLMKIAISELFDFLVYDAGDLSEIQIESNLLPQSACCLTLKALFADDEQADRSRARQLYYSSIASATVERVVNIHNGQTKVEDSLPSEFILTVQLPLLGASGRRDNEPHNGGAAIRAWTDDLTAAVRTYETDLFREVNQILSFLVHDMKNAFSFIHSWAESFGTGSKEAARAVARIRENITRIRAAAKDAEMMLSLNRAPKLSYSDITQLVNGVLASAQAAFDSKGVRLAKYFDSDLARVAVDPARIESLLANLVKNALEATDSGGFVEISVGQDRSKSLLVIKVSDSGQNFPGSQNSSPGYRVKGTGVGLMAARKIAISHGGSITMRQRANSGMEVEFSMPLNDEEQVLIAELPVYPYLNEETRQALRLGAHFRAQGDADNEQFLLKKAAELELKYFLIRNVDGKALLRSANSLIDTVVRKKAVTPGVLKNVSGEILSILKVREPLIGCFKEKIPQLLWSILRGSWSLEKSSLDELAMIAAISAYDSVNELTVSLLSATASCSNNDKLRTAVYNFIRDLLSLSDGIDEKGSLRIVNDHPGL